MRDQVIGYPGLPEEIIAELEQPLDPKRVKHRKGGGNTLLAYLKGHDVIDTANRIFKPGRWGYDIISVELNSVAGDNGEIIGAYYSARIKLTVSGCVPITEEGACPVQEARNPRAKIDAQDAARKGAITDALKRALRCYGDPFGNSLYDTDIVDGQEGVLTAEGIKNEREFAQREKTYKTATRQEGGERSSRPASTKKKYSREQITAHYTGKFAEVKTKDGAEALWAEAKELYLDNGYTEADLIADLKQIYVEAWYATQGKAAPQTQVA